MSNRKRNVAFTKPDEPDFLKRMKAEAGYKEPEEFLDKKREAIENLSDDEDDEYMEKEDEKPVVIQLKEGDLTEEQAARLAKDEAEKPADLTQKIVFKAKKKEKSNESSGKDGERKSSEKPSRDDEKKKSKKSKPTKSLLSFGDDEDDEG